MPKRPLMDASEVEVTSREAPRDWLAANHERERGVWLVSYKKTVPVKYPRHGANHAVISGFRLG